MLTLGHNQFPHRELSGTVESTMAELIKNPLIASLIAVIVTVLLTVVVTKVRNKTAVLRNSVRVDRVGFAADDPVFGSMRITWQDQSVRNLYTAALEIENATTRDFENVKFRVFTENETFLLSERVLMANTLYLVAWSDEYKKAMEIPKGGTPTQAQLDRYNHDREYLVPSLNRGQKIRFTYLCTRPSDDRVPLVWVSTQTRGIKLRFQSDLSVVLGVPVKIAMVRGLALSALVLIGCGMLISNAWLAATIAMIFGLTVQPIGALEYKVERYIWNLVSE